MDGDLCRVLRAHVPAYPIDSVRPLGAGLDNVAYLINDELLVRFSAEADPVVRAERVAREARLLAAVAGMSPMPVPQPAFAAPEAGCLAYHRIPGVPLIGVPRIDIRPEEIAAALGALLAALHAAPVDRMAALVDRDDTPLAEWRREAAQHFSAVSAWVPAGLHGPVKAFLAAAPPGGGHPLRFSHNDLGIEHVLVDPAAGTVTGVIDWSDAAIVDPAVDFGLVYRDLGPAGLDAALRSYGRASDLPALRDRAVFYARCSVFEDLTYGVATERPEYVGKSLAALDWLFAG